MRARSYLKLLHTTILPASEMHVQMVKGALGVYFVRFFLKKSFMTRPTPLSKGKEEQKGSGTYCSWLENTSPLTLFTELPAQNNLNEHLEVEASQPCGICEHSRFKTDYWASLLAQLVGNPPTMRETSV